MTKNTAITLAMVSGAMALAVWASYSLAAIGEPQSLWLWCDVIGLCPGGEQ